MNKMMKYLVFLFFGFQTFVFGQNQISLFDKNYKMSSNFKLDSIDVVTSLKETILLEYYSYEANKYSIKYKIQDNDTFVNIRDLIFIKKMNEYLELANFHIDTSKITRAIHSNCSNVKSIRINRKGPYSGFYNDKTLKEKKLDFFLYFDLSSNAKNPCFEKLEEFVELKEVNKVKMENYSLVIIFKSREYSKLTRRERAIQGDFLIYQRIIELDAKTLNVLKDNVLSHRQKAPLIFQM